METKCELFDSGIQTENSDIRAHVAVLAQKVYVFQTKIGVELLLSGKYKLKPATQPGVEGITAWGAPVPIRDFSDLRTLKIQNWPCWNGWKETLSTSEKGKRAVDVVISLLNRGRFPLWVNAYDDSRQDIQIKGTDVVVFCKQKIQIKCDFKAGEGQPLCSGNLFLQTQERNPLKRY